MQKKIYSIDSKFESEIVTSEKVEGGFIFSSPNKLPYNIDLNYQGKKDFDSSLNLKINMNQNSGK